MSTTATVQMVSLSAMTRKSEELTSNILIGKDILDLVTGAMYVDPLSIYREYVQNAADAIDEAKEEKLYRSAKVARIELSIDPSERRIRIRDNGIGIKNEDFVHIITAFGGSHKRGTKLRGFRGVGRLSGLGYAQEITFRTRSKNDKKIYEIIWDGRKLKKYLQDDNASDNLNDIVKEITTINTFSGEGWPEHFFEVELNKVIRYKNDILLNEEEVMSYLSQVAPVPFSPEFAFKEDIENYLHTYGVNQTFNVFINDNEEPLYRPHFDDIKIKEELTDKFTNLELFELEGINGDIDAIGWRLNHGYYGAIPKKEAVSGLRIRSGNIQVGRNDLLINSYPEPRFNSWTVSEIHVISKKLLPNGRRDNFEQNTHFQNLEGRVAVHCNEIAKKCRKNSAVRNRIKAVHAELEKANYIASVIKQNARSKASLKQMENEVKNRIVTMEKTLESELIDNKNRNSLTRKIDRLKKSVDISNNTSQPSDPLSSIPKQKKNVYKEVFDLIYDCAPNQVVAKGLIDKIIKRLEKNS